MAATETQQRTYKKAFLAYISVRDSKGIDDVVPDEWPIPPNSLAAIINRLELTPEEKQKALQIIQDYQKANEALYNGLADVLTRYGLSTPLLDHNKQITPEDRVSGTDLISEIFRSIDTNALEQMRRQKNDRQRD